MDSIVEMWLVMGIYDKFFIFLYSEVTGVNKFDHLSQPCPFSYCTQGARVVQRKLFSQYTGFASNTVIIIYVLCLFRVMPSPVLLQ